MGGHNIFLSWMLIAAASHSMTCCQAFTKPYHHRVVPQLTRLYVFNRNNKKNNGVLGGVGKFVKNLLPKQLTQTPQEREEERLRRNEDFLPRLFENAGGPLSPIRLMGALVSPIISTLAESISEQQKQTQDLLCDAETFIRNDPMAIQLLGGGPIKVLPPFSQSSSTSSINGKTTSRIQASFAVEGTGNRQGVATMIATQMGIEQLTLNANGRSIIVSLVKRSGSGSGGSYGSGIGKNTFNKDDIIDAELVDS